VAHRLDALLQEKRQLEKRLDEAMRGGGGDAVSGSSSSATAVDGMRIVASVVSVPDVKSLQALGDAIRERLKTGVAALGATFEDGKSTLLAVVRMTCANVACVPTASSRSWQRPLVVAAAASRTWRRQAFQTRRAFQRR
jgi:alanyl-tRNA synthetase